MMKCFVCGAPSGYLTPADTFPLCSQSCADEILFEVIAAKSGLDE